MKWARAVAVLVWLLPGAFAACSSFGASETPDADAGGAAAIDAGNGDGGACVAESCNGDGPSCRFEPFDTGCPTQDFEFTGDVPGQNEVVGQCSGGKLRLAAKNGLGVLGVFTRTTPTAVSKIHVSARIAVTAWDPGPVLTIRIASVVLAQLKAVGTPSGLPAFVLCVADGDCSSEVYTADIGGEHTFSFDMESTTTAAELSIDCKSFAKHALKATVAPSQPLELSFGKTGAAGIDGTLDDLIVSYR